MFNPLVSIVIPVYNGGNYMKQAIDSALSQTYKNIEIIVVNDGSTDNGETEKIALSYGDKIKYFYKENGGCASALNFGISKMSGEYFSWLSHDDVYFPKKIEKQIECFEKNNLEKEKTVISCDAIVINNSGKTIRKIKTKSGLLNPMDSFSRCIGGSLFNGCALLIPKKILEQIGEFSTEYIFILDNVYWTNIALRGYCYYSMPDILIKNRRHIEQVSVKKSNLSKIEIDKFANELFDRVLKDKNLQNKKTLYYYCAKTGRKELYEKIKKLLKQEGKLSIKDDLIIFKLKLKTNVLKFFKKIYHKFTIR